jgi:hypothetical protein
MNTGLMLENANSVKLKIVTAINVRVPLITVLFVSISILKSTENVKLAVKLTQGVMFVFQPLNAKPAKKVIIEKSQI